MSDTALNAMKRTALVVFCLMLVVALGLVFTRVVAARVPEQRATLERLITERTGLAVRFENVRFAWGLDGTSAVFTRVELTDPKGGRVRVVAPELRVEFDTWDFLRHQQFSLGHVTLASPDIDIIGDPEDMVAANAPAPGPRAPARASAAPVASDEAALVRRITAWAELMPNGRIEVEGARVHLLRAGATSARDRAGARTLTLSQAVISRGANVFSAYGTMLLAQDVGQSLFVSAKLQNVAPGAAVSGELRLIVRRVFLDKLPLEGVRGRGTLDARVSLRDGRVESGSWKASARELLLADGAAFDHLTVDGSLRRESGDVLLALTDLQLTRGARLERAPRIDTRLSLEPGTTRIARTRVQAERMPFMAAELVAGILAPQLAVTLPRAPDDWSATAGELHALRFDSGDRRREPEAWTFSARLDGGEVSRAADRARMAQLALNLHLDARTLTLEFDPAHPVRLEPAAPAVARTLSVGGRLALSSGATDAALVFDQLSLRSDAASLSIDGRWGDGRGDAAPRGAGLTVAVHDLDHSLLTDAWRFARGSGTPLPPLLAQLDSARIVTGTLLLEPLRTDDALGVDWNRSRGRADLAALSTSGEGAARLAGGAGTLAFARGAAQLRLTSGRVDDLAVDDARLDWPANGAPRLTGSLRGSLDSPLLRPTLAAQGLERLTGRVRLDIEARGESALRRPEAWRISARIDDAAAPIAKGLPPIQKLAGSLRYSDGQVRALSLDGSWLGGPISVESRRAPRGQLALALHGSAEAAPLLRLLADPSLASGISGQVAWSGSAQRLATNAWQLSLSSNLVGIASDLPAPLDKDASRALPLTADLRFDADGIREFAIAGKDVAIRGELQAGALRAHYELPGIEGDVRRSAAANARTEMTVDRLETRRAPATLAVATTLLPPGGELTLDVADFRHADRSLGAVRTRIARTEEGLAFSLDSAEPALHRWTAQGTCHRADARCRAEFTADSNHFAALLPGARLPAELPLERAHASGELSWPLASADLTTELEGKFDLETEGVDAAHQLVASAVLVDGQIRLDNVQGTGPEADQVFRGSGRVGLVARDYDLTVDFERMAAATVGVPTPARARLARAWSALRGTAARRGWTEAPEARRMQWHGSWDAAD